MFPTENANDLRNQITLLKSENATLKAKVQDLQDEIDDYVCECPIVRGEAEELIVKWKPELLEFIDTLKKPETLADQSLKLFSLYDDQIKDIEELLTKMVKAV